MKYKPGNGPAHARVLSLRRARENQQLRTSAPACVDVGSAPHRGPPTVTGPGLIVIGIVTGPPAPLSPPRVAAIIPPVNPAAPRIASAFHVLLRLFMCAPLPLAPLRVLLCAMIALIVLVPDVAVTLILKRPSSSLGVNPLFSDRK